MRRTFIAAIAIGVVVCVALIASPILCVEYPTVTTLDGPVRGMSKSGVRQFLGIPYAAPPIGKLRWRPPEPHAPWTAALDATSFGQSCPQVRRGGSEDCLVLNIFTPEPPAAHLPVMFWIHGGAFVLGSGSSYDGSGLALKHKMVVVTINYRLGALGFLASSSLDAESTDHVSGNYGLLDQQAALKWVSRNIAAFGGDPKKVTIAGESAGGISVCNQLASPQASGLFVGAIVESGPCLHERTMAQAETRGGEFGAKLGCDKSADQAACMRAKSADEVVAAMPGSGSGPLIWAPIVDGRVLPQQPADAFRAGTFNKVPVINGSNRDEGTLFVAFDQPIPKDSYAEAIGRFARAPNSAPGTPADGAGAAKVVAAYPLASYASPEQGFAAVLGDAVFSCPIEKTGQLLSAHVPTYQYEFNDRAAPSIMRAPPPFPLGAYHAAEIQYVFETGFPAHERPGAPPFSSAQLALSEEMGGYWSAFIANGNPGESSPKWKPEKPGDAKILSLAPDGIRYETDFDKAHHCALWNSLHEHQP